MYEWTFGICGYITIGRTWEEFEELYNEIVRILDTDEWHRLVIFVHNLPYEFQFMRERFRWQKVFSMEERKPVQCLTEEGIEFRCSYKLSGYGLAKLGDQLQKYKCKKMVGDLDYDKLRHSKTPLTNEELHYCANDVLVVMCYIQELIEREGDITRLPLTKTGFVRRYCRNACLYDKDDRYNIKFKNYRRVMQSLTLTADVYKMLREAFAGGFTHANACYSGDELENVSSFDFTSSYPYVMVSEKFPMSQAVPRNITGVEDFEEYLKIYCCLFEIELINVEAIVFFENYISKSKCKILEGGEINNGRVVSARRLVMTVTEQDYTIIKATYAWDECRVGKFYTFRKGYLPTDFVKSILDLYVLKTQLKNVAGKEVEYLVSKENINSCYGMTVTDICRDEILYNDNEWSTTKPELETAIARTNRSVKRFLYYPWGVWVTAYARINLWTGILEFGDDYVYSDTDSVKVLNADKHMDYINMYNRTVDNKLKSACKYHGFDFAITHPKTVKGVEKPLGVWDFEKTYTRFKTLGAKRYLVEYEDKETRRRVREITVAGLGKREALAYMEKNSTDPFDIFNEELYIPKGSTGKNTHTYIDAERHGVMRDYLGNVAEYHELSGVHLEPADYSFSLAEDYINYLLKIKQLEETGYEP